MVNLEILDTQRQSLLPKIVEVGQGFYLAGGTALALQLGHRDSIDFDFFTTGDVDTTSLWQQIETVFIGHHLQKTQEEKDTLSLVLDGDVRISFFGYHYPLLEPVIPANGLELASVLDIGCMKLSAITGRSTLKDYVDLYFIFKKMNLATLLEASSKKFPTLDQALILKSLVYFDDIEPEPIRFMPGFAVDLSEVETLLTRIVKEYLK